MEGEGWLLAKVDKSSSGDEIPERDVTYLLSVYFCIVTTELRMTRTSNGFSDFVVTSIEQASK